MRHRICLAFLILAFARPAIGSGITVGVSDLAFSQSDLSNSSAVLVLNPSGLIHGYSGYPQLAGAFYTERMSLFDFSVATFTNLTFDHVYLSVTEIRSGTNLAGTANIYLNDGHFPTAALNIDSVDAATQQAFDNGQTLIGTITGTGVAGNHVLVDITSAIQGAMAGNQTYIGLLIRDDINDGQGIGILGRNYNSGFPQQYYASSLYEYPTLLATQGDGTTPFDQLPARPVTNDPLGPPSPTDPNDPLGPPTQTPEPTTITMLVIGMSGLACNRWRRRMRRV